MNVAELFDQAGQQPVRELRLVLGDQLNEQHSWWQGLEPDVLYLIAELGQEMRYVRHHRQKMLAFMLAMQRFAEQQRAKGHRVLWLSLEQTKAFADLPELLRALLQHTQAQSFAFQQPDEYRLSEQLRAFCQAQSIPCAEFDSEHFLTPRDAHRHYPHSRMEFFYRALRKQHGVLMQEGKPEGGQWNYDHDNRGNWPKGQPVPEPLLFANDARAADQRLQQAGVPSLGQAEPQALLWPVDRQQGLALLQYFIAQLLPHFGALQDAMTPEGWSLYHSRLSLALNLKLLQPLEVIRAVEQAWRDQPERYPLASVEGFIRQILGWREFVRLVYWQRMPDYGQHNHLQAERPLPEFYWHGQTKMACMAHAIGQSLEHAYAHHIQRLMITGNFALLAGIHPDQVEAWYLGIYIDAIEWVEMPNTRGMSQFADGGIMASKPYCSSGAYIQRMGRYCQDCHYQVKKAVGEGSCPFNSLYWHFAARHQAQLASNPRMALVYKNWQRKSASEQQQLLAQAEQYLAKIEQL